MKKFLILSSTYPSKENIYNNMFIHTRVKNYIKRGLNIEIFSYNPSSKIKEEYKYENVKVTVGNEEILKNVLKSNEYEKIIIHFALKEYTTILLNNIDKKIPIIIWVHLYEASGWYRRLFGLELNFKKLKSFINYIRRNRGQLKFFNKLITKYSNEYDITFIFVSNWIKNICEKDTKTKDKIKKYYIIPNVIDENYYTYKKKDPKQRFNIISIRTYSSKKYANDITAKVIKNLSKKEYFDKLNISIFGDGVLFDKITNPLRKYKNVKITKGFLNAKQMNKEYNNNGITLLPTRQDSQGVTMGEAMMAGVVPIVSNNSAIPEYMNNDCGYLCNNVNQMVNAIEELIKNEEIFIKKSASARNYIYNKCRQEIIIEKEINILTQ